MENVLVFEKQRVMLKQRGLGFKNLNNTILDK